MRLTFPAIAPSLILAVFLLPIGMGLVGTWLPALGWFPALGQYEFSLQPWQQLWHYPGFRRAVQHSLVTGLVSACLALLITFILLVAFYPSPLFNRIQQSLSPILSLPHAAFAIGIGYLVAPSGWWLRLVAEVTGWPDSPPNWLTFKDPWGISLILVLVLKEVPFLLLMALAALPALNVNATLWLGQSLGYGRLKTWLMLLWPPLYQQLRLPFFAVLAFSLSVVDLALIAGPTTPPTLAALVTRLFNDADLLLRLPGAVGACCLLFITLAALVTARLLEKPGRWLLLVWLRNSKRWPDNGLIKLLAASYLVLSALFYCSALMVLVLWSITHQWRFPDAWPASFSWQTWQSAWANLPEPFLLSLITALAASGIALTLVIGALENEGTKEVRSVKKWLWLLYVPLLVPQIAFLFGFQVSLLWLGLTPNWLSLLWAHLVFVLPYVFLTLSGPYRAFDNRYTWLALSLSGSPARSFWRIKLAMLVRPIAFSFAVGFAVSIAQYLPTLFIGGGRFSTLTTEAVNFASGSNRRITALYGLLQQALPLFVFMLAIGLPAWLYRGKSAMRDLA